MRTVWSLLLIACTGTSGSGNTGDVDLCEQVAIEDGNGNPDPCDVEACRSCEDACEEPCAVLESYPPQYSCSGGETFTVYDTCPDWGGTTSL